MFQNKSPRGSLLLAGIAAFAFYKYSKLSADEKSKLSATVKEKGKKLYDQYVPAELKTLFDKKQSSQDDAAGSSSL